MAWLAVCALFALILSVCIFVVYSRGAVLVFGLLVGIGVATIVALGWWAFTTRRAWKRRLNTTLAICIVAAIMLGVATFSLLYGFGVLVVAVLAVVYAVATRAALNRGPAASLGLGLASGNVASAAPSRPWLLVNPRSGDGKATKLGLVDAARLLGVDVRILAPGEDSVQLARQAVVAGADAIGVAGGDGSLGPIAAIAVEYGIPFVCIPAGTRNHFARDLGLDRDAPLSALDAYTGIERLVDVGVVGDRVFLNNVSLGAYASMVHQSGYRANKLGTARATLPAALRADHATPPALSFMDSTGRLRTDTVVLLVANNEYDLRPPFDVGSRQRLNGGVLQMSALLPATGVQLAATLARVSRTRRDLRTTLLQWTSAEFSVDGATAELPLAIDGEAVELALPIDFKVLPLALRVLVPSTAAAVAAGAIATFRWGTVRRLWALARGRAS